MLVFSSTPPPPAIKRHPHAVLGERDVHRIYSDSDAHTLRFVKRARTLGFSMEDIRELLSLWQNKARSSAAVKKIAAGHMAGLKQRIGEMQAMVATLEHLTQHCHGDHRPECPILDDLAKA